MSGVFRSVVLLLLFMAVAALWANAKPASGSRDKEIKKRLLKLEVLVKKQQALIQAQTKRVAELEEKLRKLSAERTALEEAPKPKEAPEPEQAPSKEEEAPESPAAPPSIPTTGSEKQLPDVSVIANAHTSLTSDPQNPDRNRFLLDESEIGMQGFLYPGIRGDAFFSFGRPPGGTGLVGSLEEAYGTFLETPIRGVAVKGGKMRIDFGKRNKIHPHHLPYQDRPAVLRNFLGDDGLNGHGVEADYLLPTPRGTFAQLQFGFWKPEPPELDPLTGLEAADAGSRIFDHLLTSRLWTSAELGGDSELELGLSGGWGRSLMNGSGDGQVDPIRVYGADLTFRKFPSAHERILLSGEWLLYQRQTPIGTASRNGYYLLGTYQPNRYWEVGMRYDNSGVPFPADGRESALTGFLTNNLTETTYMRYQLKHGTHLDGASFNEFMIQFVWGIGPHAHPLQ